MYAIGHAARQTVAGRFSQVDHFLPLDAEDPADARIAQRKVLPQQRKLFVITVEAFVEPEMRIFGRQLVERARELVVGQRQNCADLADADDSISPEQLEPSVSSSEVQQISRS